MKNLPIKAKISRILSWLWLHNLIPGSSRHVEYVTSGSCGRHPPDTELRLCCLLASLYPGLLSLCDIQLRSPLLALLYSAASRFVVRASALTRAGCAALLRFQAGSCQQDLHSLRWLLQAPLLPRCTHMGPEAPQGKRDSCKTYLNASRMCVCMYAFIYLFKMLKLSSFREL